MAVPAVPPPVDGQTLKRRMLLQQLIANATSLRRDFLKSVSDPRRDLNDACGYPAGWIAPDLYQELYERDGIAARVVEIWPKETWQVTPRVYEDEDPDVTTPFEQAWNDLSRNLNLEPDYLKDNSGGPIWDVLARADKLCGIGHYGVILLGLNDGKPLHEPAEGVIELFSQPKLVEKEPNPGAKADGKGKSGGKEDGEEDDGNGRPGFNPQPSANHGRYVLTRNAQLLDPKVTRKKKPKPADPGEDTRGGKDGDEENTNPGAGSEYGMTETEPGEEVEVSSERKLLYLRVFPEAQALITSYETNPTSPRYGMPTAYSLTEVTDEEGTGSGQGATASVREVHWTRVIHVIDDAGSSEVWGVPRMRTVFNRLKDLQKLYGGSAEMYWRGAFPGLSFESTQPFGEEADYDEQALKDMYEEYANDLQRALFLTGMTVKSLAPQVVTAREQIDSILEAVAIAADVPKRILMGSERGELSSGQDQNSHNKKVKRRQQRQGTGRIIRPFVNRLIFLGVLPAPSQGYSVLWPEIEVLSEKENAQNASVLMDALSKYVVGKCDQIMPPLALLTKVFGYEEKEAQGWIEEARVNSEERAQRDAQMAMDQARGMAEIEAANRPEPDRDQSILPEVKSDPGNSKFRRSKV